MAEKVRLVYRDFRPLKRGEAGYSSTKRLLISPSTGEVISRRQFINNAEKIGEQRKETGKARKTRIDKGVSRSDYKELKPLLKEFQKQGRRPARLTPELGKNRYESAKRHHIDKLNKEREKRDYEPLDYSYEPDEPEFYDLYDVIRHPENYDTARISDAHDYFWGDVYDEEADYDYPFGETP